ncbi:MAG: inorganic phosphate transporter, partial [Deltaproteobacteria bacterium]
LITWWFGMPSSSSHALVGGLIGSALVKNGYDSLVWTGIIKTSIFIVLAPTIGLLLGLVLMVVVSNLFKNVRATQANNTFKYLQMLSAAIYSMSHGMNDAQKTMGIIALVLFSGGYLGTTFYIPLWVSLTCYLFISLGTMGGGWRIVKTMGSKITKLRPVDGFCAEMAAAISIIGATFGGIPVSTTHTITGSIIGVGAVKRLTAVRWGVAGSIIWAWVLTIPMAAIISAMSYQALTFLGVK